MPKVRSIELLAPAKDLQCGIEAINHGADAVYIGSPKFSARAAAGNTLEDIRTLCSYAHQFGARIYVAFNTILTDEELSDAETIIWELYRAGADALIVYDYDSATVFGFLHEYGLEHEIKVNIEANHATLAGHSFHHEIATAVSLGIFGSIDANRGDPQNGWDTDQFPNSVEEMTLATYEILKAGGFKNGGYNFDSKVRRQSLDEIDLFHGHVAAMDVLALALERAAAMVQNDRLQQFKDQRYAGWQQPLGQAVLAGEFSLESLAEHAFAHELNPQAVSGRQEMLEGIVNRFIYT